MGELIENAFNGVNIIPTVLLILVLIYWLSVILGIFDLDFFDVDIDIDLETDLVGSGGNSLEGFQAVLAFFNLGHVPLMVVLSIVALIFWFLAMFLKIFPITPGGFINGIILIPLFIVSLFISKLITTPLKSLFREDYDQVTGIEEEVVGHLVKVISTVKDNRLGQAEIERDGAEILINVKAEFSEDSFQRNEEAYVSKKDEEKNIYYIVKTYSK